MTFKERYLVKFSFSNDHNYNFKKCMGIQKKKNYVKKKGMKNVYNYTIQLFILFKCIHSSRNI